MFTFKCPICHAVCYCSKEECPVCANKDREIQRRNKLEKERQIRNMAERERQRNNRERMERQRRNWEEMERLRKDREERAEAFRKFQINNH